MAAATGRWTCTSVSRATSRSRASPDRMYIHMHFGVGYRFAAEPVAALPVDGPVDPAVPQAD